jgi:serralysin
LRNSANTGFDAKTDFSVGSNPYSVAVGDFNSDGKLDLAAANYYGNSVSVLLNADPSATLTITDAPANTAPTIASGATANFAENGTGTAYQVIATDPESNPITYGLNQTGDWNLFNINSTTGLVTFKTAPNYESPTDAGANNVYDITVTASDGSLSTSKAVAITVTNVNEVPVFASGATANFAENGTGTAYQVIATDPESNPITYGLATTGDYALFNINSTTGLVTFKTAPNYESPTDAGANNVYDITVTASDSSLTTSQAVAITVTNVNEVPVFASGATATFAENGTGTAYQVIATDPESNPITYGLSQTGDWNLFNINSATGLVTFKTAPNYESPTDLGANNVYDITVTASDSSLTTSKAVAITVTDVNPENFVTTLNQDQFALGTGDDSLTSPLANLQQNDNINALGGTDTLILTGGTASDWLGIDASDSNNQIDIVGTTLTNFERFDLSGFLGTVSFKGLSGNNWIKSGAGKDDLTGYNGNDYTWHGHGLRFSPPKSPNAGGL